MKIDTIVLATGNEHKVSEMSAILAVIYAERGKKSEMPRVISMREAGFTAEIEETGSTYAENALLKATAVQKYLLSDSCKAATLGAWVVVADDSGVEIDAFDGAPGLYSARWLGTFTTENKNAEVLRLMADKKDVDRHAAYRCHMVALYADGMAQTGEGSLSVRVAKEAAGCGGFGYDPIMIPDGYDKTIAELGTEEKNQISHRNRALQDLFIKVLDN